MGYTILNVGHHYYIKSGADSYLFALESLLSRHNNNVVPFVASKEENHDTSWSCYFPPGVNVDSPSLSDAMRFIYSLPAKRSMRRLLQDVSVDIAHLHIYYGHLTTAILSPLRRAGIPIVQSLHEYKLTCPVYTHVSKMQICEACGGKDFWKAVPRLCNKNSLARTLASVAEAYVSRSLGDVSKVDHFIAVSDFLRRKILEHGIVEPEKITTIHNFVDPSCFAISRRAGSYVLYFGRITAVKGVRTLIEAITPLRDVPLYIVGDGDQRAALEAHVARNELQHIRFLGFRQGDTLRELIRNSICVILPAEWYENCPISVLESLATGRPVIGTDIGGLPELITTEVDGFLVPPGDAEALRERILWMAMHTKEAVEMGLAGREKVETRFNPEGHYEKILSVYQQVL